MDSQKLREVVEQMEALKVDKEHADFHAGVNAVMDLVRGTVQTALDKEEMKHLEQRLGELKGKYPRVERKKVLPPAPRSKKRRKVESETQTPAPA